jgi:hypothetical protein
LLFSPIDLNFQVQALVAEYNNNIKSKYIQFLKRISVREEDGCLRNWKIPTAIIANTNKNIPLNTVEVFRFRTEPFSLVFLADRDDAQALNEIP